MKKLLILGLVLLTGCKSSSFTGLDGTFYSTCDNYHTKTYTISGLNLVQSEVYYADSACATKQFTVVVHRSLADKGGDLFSNTVNSLGLINHSDPNITTACSKTVVQSVELDISACSDKKLALAVGYPTNQYFTDLTFTVGTVDKTRLQLNNGKLCFGGTDLDSDGYPKAIDTSTCLSPQ